MPSMQTDIQYMTPVKFGSKSSAHKWGLEDSHKENQSPGLLSPLKKQKYKRWRTTDQKLHDIFMAIHDADWGLLDFLYFVFWHKDAEGKEIHCEQAHGNVVQWFLAGNCVYTPAQILHLWYRSKDGCQEDLTLMFSTTKPYMEISALYIDKKPILPDPVARTANRLIGFTTSSGVVEALMIRRHVLSENFRLLISVLWHIKICT